jgi:hypothetical protein
VIAGQLRHTDSGALAQRVYTYQLSQTAPPGGRIDRGDPRPGGAGRTVGVASVSGERNRSDTRPGSRA